MSFQALMTSVDVLTHHGAQILVAGVLVQPFGDLLPADGVVEIPDLALDFHFSAHRRSRFWRSFPLCATSRSVGPAGRPWFERTANPSYRARHLRTDGPPYPARTRSHSTGMGRGIRRRNGRHNASPTRSVRRPPAAQGVHPGAYRAAPCAGAHGSGAD